MRFLAGAGGGDSGAGAAFALVEFAVGGFEEILHAPPIVRKNADADADAESRFFPARCRLLAWGLRLGLGAWAGGSAGESRRPCRGPGRWPKLVWWCGGGR